MAPTVADRITSYNVCYTKLLREYEHISEGDTVKTTGRILEVPVGPELLGRVVNTLGHGPIEGKIGVQPADHVRLDQPRRLDDPLDGSEAVIATRLRGLGRPAAIGQRHDAVVFA